MKLMFFLIFLWLGFNSALIVEAEMKNNLGVAIIFFLVVIICVYGGYVFIKQIIKDIFD